MQEPKVGDKFHFEDRNIDYTIINVIKYNENGEFNNKLYEGGYQIKYINPETLSEEMKCGIKYDEELSSFVNFYAIMRGTAKRVVAFTNK